MTGTPLETFPWAQTFREELRHAVEAVAATRFRGRAADAASGPSSFRIQPPALRAGADPARYAAEPVVGVSLRREC